MIDIRIQTRYTVKILLTVFIILVMKYTYYYNKDYTKPIQLCVDENNGNVVVSSDYWENDYVKIIICKKQFK